MIFVIDCSRRPALASMCDSIGEAEKWRRELIRDVSRKVSEIQNGKGKEEKKAIAQLTYHFFFVN